MCHGVKSGANKKNTMALGENLPTLFESASFLLLNWGYSYRFILPFNFQKGSSRG